MSATVEASTRVTPPITNVDILAKLIANNAINRSLQKSKVPRPATKSTLIPDGDHGKYHTAILPCGAVRTASIARQAGVEVASLAFCDAASQLHTPTFRCSHSWSKPHPSIYSRRTSIIPRSALAYTHLFAPDHFPFHGLRLIYVSSYLPICRPGLHLYHNLTLDHWA